MQGERDILRIEEKWTTKAAARISKMKKKKILLVTTVANTLGGFLLPFAEALKREGWVVDAMASEFSSNADVADEFDRVWDVPFSRQMSRVAIGFIPSIQRIRRILKREGYTLIHTHTPFASFIVRLSAATISRTTRPKIIYTAHGFHFHPLGGRVTNSLFFGAEKLAARWTDVLVVINREDYESAVRKHLIDPAKIRRLPGIGVDSVRFDPGRYDPEGLAAKRHELGIADGDAIFVMLAEFAPGKRHIDTVRAVETLAGKNVHLLFAGGGRLKDSIQREVALRGLEDQIWFLGVRRDVPELMLISNAVILPSLREGLPRVLLEALSMNVPIIATDIRGTRELLGESRGILVPVKDPERLAQAMAWIIDHEDEAREMGARGRTAVLANYDDGIVLARQMEIIEEALGNPCGEH
jgi:glycosyltransferase involved in cell wall biosynthesis